MSSAKTLRRVRAGVIGLCVGQSADGALFLARGHGAAAAVIFGIVLTFALAALLLTCCTRNLARRKPDHALIARLEREVYGETFEHDRTSR